jgi:Zn-dependent M28 family amino/carboxypeptidase
MKKNILVFLLIFTFLLPSAASAQQAIKISSKERKMAEAITVAQLKDYLYFIASDAMEGRDTPSRGLDVTAEFIKMNLSRWGFKPAGDNGTFFQKIELTRETLDAEKTGLEIGGQALKMGDDFFRFAGTGSYSGPMVFGRDGWMVKSKGIDAFRNIDVAGKIVVLAGPQLSLGTVLARPQGVTPDDVKGEKGVDWADPLTYARQKGAAGIIFVAPPPLESRWDRLRGFFTRGRTYPVKLDDFSGPNPPVMIISRKASEALFAGEAGGMDSEAGYAMSKTGTVSAAIKSETLWTQNVAAVWEGGDPVLKNEFVAIGAHYDHVGINPNVAGPDKLYNGADDDGSGTVAVLSIAEALAKAPSRPKRSTLFVWHCGEEKGLWGSEYWNKFPTVDVKKVVTQLNIDMIGRSLDPNNIIKCDPKSNKPCNEELSKADEIYVIGAEMMSSALGAVTKGTNSAYLNLGYNTRYDDPNDKNKFFFRSDHFNYAHNGIPIVFWFDGVHEDYHQPGDTPDKIDYVKMEKVTRTIFLTLLKVSDLKQRPAIDKKLPPELTER